MPIQRKLRTHEAAAREILKAASWYETGRAGLGREFLGEVQHRLRLLELGLVPSVGLPELIHVPGLSRILLHRFPYSIVFSTTPTEIVVVAVAHFSRDPGYWGDRLGRLHGQ